MPCLPSTRVVSRDSRRQLNLVMNVYRGRHWTPLSLPLFPVQSIKLYCPRTLWLHSGLHSIRDSTWTEEGPHSIRIRLATNRSRSAWQRGGLLHVLVQVTEYTQGRIHSRNYSNHGLLRLPPLHIFYLYNTVPLFLFSACINNANSCFIVTGKRVSIHSPQLCGCAWLGVPLKRLSWTENDANKYCGR